MNQHSATVRGLEWCLGAIKAVTSVLHLSLTPHASVAGRHRQRLLALEEMMKDLVQYRVQQINSGCHN